MRAGELFADLPLLRAPKDVGAEITRVVTSPREAGGHTLYVACKTALGNGRFGMEMAFARGCRAFLCANDAYPGEGASVWIAEDPERLLGTLAARLYGYPARGMTVLGITGSAGKSSVALQTVRVLRECGRRVSALTSDGLDLLGEQTYPSAVVPDAARIQEALWEMARAGTEIAVLELSSYQLAHFAAEEIPFTAVLLTNLSPRHIGHGEHESFDTYRAAKHMLLRAPSAFCVLPVGQEVQTDTQVLRTGNGGDLWAEEVRSEWFPAKAPQTRFLLCDSTQKCEIILPVIGDFAIENALCTAALCRIAGLELSEIAAGLSKHPVKGRMECLFARQERLIYLDAAFLPQDLSRVLEVLRLITKGRLCVLLGSVGGRAKERRVALARVAEELADRVYLTADDPDAEDPAQICEQMRLAMREPMRATVLSDRRAAILRAVREMRPSDLLLILAKPYAIGQLVAGEYLPFDERVTVAEAIAEF